MDKLSAEVVTALSKLGPSLSSILAKKLEEDLGITAALARKRIERAKAQDYIAAIEGLSLKHKEQFLYVPGQQQDGSTFLKALIFALEGSKYNLPLLGISARGGIVPQHIYPSVSGLPVSSDITGKTSAAEAMEQLFEWNLLERKRTPAGVCIRLTEMLKLKQPSARRIIGRIMAENILLIALADWFRLQGMVSHDSISVRDEEEAPQFAYYQWDFVAPSYLSPLRSYKETKLLPGFLVADVILGRRLSLEDVQYFVSKCSAIRSRTNNRSFLPFLIADWFEKDALMLGRKHGLIFTTPKNLFGIPFRDALDSMEQIIEHKDGADERLDKVLRLFNSIGHLQATFKAMKKTCLTLVAGQILQSIYDGVVDYSRVYSSREQQHELDLLLSNSDSNTLVVAQCKSIESAASDLELEEWINDTVPKVHSILSRRSSFSEIKNFEYYFVTDADAQEKERLRVKKLNASRQNPYLFFLCDRGDLQEMAAKVSPGFQKLASTLLKKKYYDDEHETSELT